ncbi:MAG: ZIP family metal transporter, partial [Candidatus Jacksonbacteria bacterium]
MIIYICIFLSVIIVSALSFVGVLFLAISVAKLKKIVIFLVSLSAGSLLGGAALHLMPEAISEYGSTMPIWYYFLAGIIIFFIL